MTNPKPSPKNYTARHHLTRKREAVDDPVDLPNQETLAAADEALMTKEKIPAENLQVVVEGLVLLTVVVALV